MSLSGFRNIVAVFIDLFSPTTTFAQSSAAGLLLLHDGCGALSCWQKVLPIADGVTLKELKMFLCFDLFPSVKYELITRN